MLVAGLVSRQFHRDNEQINPFGSRSLISLASPARPRSTAQFRRLSRYENPRLHSALHSISARRALCSFSARRFPDLPLRFPRRRRFARRCAARLRIPGSRGDGAPSQRQLNPSFEPSVNFAAESTDSICRRVITAIGVSGAPTRL